jgi:multiple sugar transport system ATP-binding protein
LNVYNKPINKFVAGFIGSPPMNFLKGRIVKKNGNLYFSEGNFLIQIMENMYDKLKKYIETEVIFGVRPENVYDKLFATNATPENTVRVACEVVETMGSENYVYLSNGKNTFIAVVDASNIPSIGSTIEVVFDMKKVHFFDSSSDETIV